MTFTNKIFKQVLEFYKDKNNFHKNAKDVYQSLSKVSIDDDSNHDPLIQNDDVYLFNLDNLCYNSFLSKSGHINSNLPSSVDGLHYFWNGMYFIEFKGEPFSSQNYKEKLNDVIEILKENISINQNKYNEKLISDLEEIESRYEDEIICKLKTKPIESIFIVLPKLYERYCIENKIEPNNAEFMNWLFNVSKRIIIVFLDDDVNSKNGQSKSYKHLRKEHTLKVKYAPLKNLVNSENSIVTQSEFKEIFLDKIKNS